MSECACCLLPHCFSPPSVASKRIHSSPVVVAVAARMQGPSANTMQQAVINGVAVVRLFQKEGELVGKLLLFLTQLLWMFGLTFYAVANSAVSNSVSFGEAQGGIVFLYAITIGASWAVLIIILQIVDGRNIVIAGKFPLLTALLILLVVIFLCVVIGSVVALGDAAVGAGTAIGYVILTWLFTEILQAVSVVAQFKLGQKPKSIEEQLADDGDDEYAEARGTFQGVDESIAVSPSKQAKASTAGTEEEHTSAFDDDVGLEVGSSGGGHDDDDDDLGLL